ncbi:serine/threonine-protein kinase NIM1-like [Watersipora subatra]|uniref:serine/threonine-protein kinase NIM1-like n=1 Tax=Watersipora subatra TaxID=2589382 RepID=UPI00355C73A4
MPDMTPQRSMSGEETEDSHKTPYEQLNYLLHNDARCLKETTLHKRVGFYRFRGDLGTGNFSQVKIAVNSLTRERVAVKILDKTKIDEKTQRLLSREIKSMDRLRHPNIIRLYEVFDNIVKMHIIMEYAANGELFTKLTSFGKLPEKEAKSNLSQIISAVTHMHDHDIIHRDLKAENIFYSGTIIKVGDFGFSTISKRGESLNTFCGSPPYAAPELFKDEHYEGRYVDIWAIGILLFFMVTGVMPFRADTVGKLKKCIIEGNFTVPSYVAASCQFIIRNTLKRQPKERLSLADIARNEWLEGQTFPEPLHKFEAMPYQALSSSGSDEKETLEELHRLGITEKVIRENKDQGVTNSITGFYRQTLHKLQKRKYACLSDGSTTSRSTSSSNSLRRGSTIMRGSSRDAKQKQQSKLCTIL